MKSTEDGAIPTIMKSYYLHDQKKHISVKSPDINKMQVIVIDGRTKIYIAVDADPEEARNRYFNRQETKGKVPFTSKKPVAPAV